MSKLFDIYSQEAISYQIKDWFVDETEEIVTDIYKEISSNRYKNNEDFVARSPLIKRLASTITKRFGISCSFPPELSTMDVAAVFLNVGDTYLLSNVSNFLDAFKNLKSIEKQKVITDFLKRNREILEQSRGKKGYIDLKNAKVGGYFSTFEQFFIFDFFKLKQVYNLTPREVVAAMLHEIGHVIHGMEESLYIEKVNLIFLDIITDINNNRLDRAITKYNKDLRDIKDINVAVLPENTTREHFDRAVFYAYIDFARKQMLNYGYLNTNTEALADNFAAKFGLNAELVSGLNKITSKHLSDFKVLNYLSIGSIFLVFGSLFSFSIPVFVASLFISLFMLLTKSELGKPYIYDDFVDRYKRIRNVLVRMIVDIEKVSSERAQAIYNQLKIIDEVIEKTPNMEDFMKKVADFIIPYSSKALHYKNINRMIEDGMNNELYVQALRLKLS
jgi:hypothetical protein